MIIKNEHLRREEGHTLNQIASISIIFTKPSLLWVCFEFVLWGSNSESLISLVHVPFWAVNGLIYNTRITFAQFEHDLHYEVFLEGDDIHLAKFGGNTFWHAWWDSEWKWIIAYMTFKVYPKNNVRIAKNLFFLIHIVIQNSWLKHF